MFVDIEQYFYRCSKDYISSINCNLYNEVYEVVSTLPKRATQAEINKDFFWLLTSKGWSYDSKPAGLTDAAPPDLGLKNVNLPIQHRDRSLCLSSMTLKADWHTDFAKTFADKLV